MIILNRYKEKKNNSRRKLRFNLRRLLAHLQNVVKYSDLRNIFGKIYFCNCIVYHSIVALSLFSEIVLLLRSNSFMQRVMAVTY